MFLSRIAALYLFAVGPTAWADSIDVNLRDTSAQFRYSASMGRDTLGRSELHLGYLYTSENNSLIDMGLLVQDEVGGNTPGITVGVGIKGLIARIQNSNSKALAMGGLVRIAPFSDARFGIAGQVFMSPNIVTFGDADRFTETGVRLDYEAIPQAVVYAGYRRIHFNLKARPDAVLDEGVHVGVKVSF